MGANVSTSKPQELALPGIKRIFYFFIFLWCFGALRSAVLGSYCHGHGQDRNNMRDPLISAIGNPRLLFVSFISNVVKPADAHLVQAAINSISASVANDRL